jgi:hypothetical protein
MAMLENAFSAEIVLTHSAVQTVHWRWDERVRLFEFAKRQVERLFVAMHVAVVEIGVLVEPKRETKRFPAPDLIHHDLPAFEFRLVGPL